MNVAYKLLTIEQNLLNNFFLAEKLKLHLKKNTGPHVLP